MPALMVEWGGVGQGSGGRALLHNEGILGID